MLRIKVSLRSHCKQFLGETNLESPFQNQDEIKKKPREKESLKK